MPTTSDAYDAPAAALKKPCCVCDEPGGQHCTKCKSRHYCGKACQLVDWYDRGHKAQCKQLAAEFQDRLLDEGMPAKMKIKEEPAIVEGVAPADGFKACLPAARTAKVVKTTALNGDSTDWRGTCAICLDNLLHTANFHFYECCCKNTCNDCAHKCLQYGRQCPLCRATLSTSAAEWLSRVKKHVDTGNAEAQVMLACAHRTGRMGLKKDPKLAFQLYDLAAAHAKGQSELGGCYERGTGVKIDFKAAAQWYWRAAEQGYPAAQVDFGFMFRQGEGVAQSLDEAVKWYRLAAAQGHPTALFNLGVCYANGNDVAQDDDEALCWFKRAAAKGQAGAAAEVDKRIAARPG